MNKRKLILVLFILGIFLFFTVDYDGPPAKFPSNDTAIDRMNTLFPKAEIRQILDVLLLDNRHAYVPFVSDTDQYGATYWIWDKFQWKIARLDTRGEPMLWKLKLNDPTTHYLVWNIDPTDQLQHIRYYLLKDRGYYISRNINVYSPRVQLERDIPVAKQSYGLLQLPQDWARLIRDNDHMAKAHSAHPTYLGWAPYNQQEEQSFPGHTVNSSSYSKKFIHLEFVRIINEPELEGFQ